MANVPKGGTEKGNAGKPLPRSLPVPAQRMAGTSAPPRVVPSPPRAESETRPLPPPPRVPPPPRRTGPERQPEPRLSKPALPPESEAPRPPRREPAPPANDGLTLLPNPPEVTGSESIHPDPYARAASVASPVGAALGDRQGVARELTLRCERELEHENDRSRRARLHYECARLYEGSLGDRAAALDHYQKARTLGPEHLPTLSGLRRILSLDQKFAELEQVLAQELELAESPDIRGALWFERGLIQEQRLHQPAQAKSCYQAALELLPGDARVLRALERSWRREGDHAALRDVLDAQASLAAADPALLSARLAERARDTELFAGSPDAALQGYERALEADGLGSAAIEHALKLHTKQAQFGDVVMLEQRRTALFGDPALCAAYLARTADLLSEQLSDPNTAVALLERAASLSPADPSALFRLVHLYERLGDHPARVRTLERLLALAANTDTKVALALSLADIQRTHLRDTSSSVRWLEMAHELKPEQAVALDTLGSLYREQRDFAALAALLGRRVALSEEPEVRLQLSLEIAELYERELGDVAQAITHYKAALSLCQDHAVALCGLTRLLHRERRYHELVEIHERAAALGPDEAATISHLLKAALIYEDLLGLPDSALGAYQRVLEREAGHLLALRGAQRLAEATSDFALAVRLYERELCLVPNDAHKIPLLLRAAELCERHLHDDARALGLLDEVRLLDPSMRSALAASERIQRHAERHEALVQIKLREAELKSSDDTRAELLLSVARIIENKLGQRERAIEYYRSAFEANQASEQMALELEQVLTRAGRFEELETFLNQRQAELGTASDRHRVCLDLGRVREVRLQKTADALDAYDRALDAMPDSLAACLGRIRCLTELGHHAPLVKDLERLAKLTNDPNARLLGLLLAGELFEGELNQPAQAILCYEQVLGLAPDHRGALLALERLYQNQNRSQEQNRVRMAEVQALGALGEQVAVLDELTRAPQVDDSERTAIQNAALRILERQPDNLRALWLLEESALAEQDAARLAEIDERWVARLPRGPRRASYRTRLAEYLEAKNPLRAIDQHRLALEEDPENISAARGLTRLAEVVGDVDVLCQAGETEFSVVRCPERAGGLFRQAARDALAAGRHARAAEILQRALTLNPDDAQSAALLSDVLGGLGQHETLIALLTSAASAARDAEVRAGHWISVARLMAKARGDVGAGIGALSRLALAEPGHALVLLELAELFIRDRQWEPAAERLREALECHPDPATATAARMRLAELYQERLGRTEEAGQLLRELFAMNPGAHTALGRLLAIEIETNDPNAEKTAELWVSRAQGAERAQALTTLGRLQRDSGNTSGAKQTLARAVALLGLTDTEGDRDLYRILEKESLSGAAADWALYARSLSEFCAGEGSPERKADALLEVAKVSIDRIGNREQGYAALRAALGLKPRNVALQAELARCFLEGKHYDRALPELQRLLEFDPLRPDTWSDLAASFDALGKHAEAELARGPLVLLGGGNDLARAAWNTRQPNYAVVEDQSIDRDVMYRAAGTSLPEGVQLLLQQLSALAPKFADVGPERYGLGARDRVPAKSQHPLKLLVDRLARIFRLPEVALYTLPGHGAPAIVLGDPVGIVVPEALATLTEPQQVFCLAQQLGRIALGIELGASLGNQQSLLLVAGATALVGGEFGASMFPPDEVEDTARRLAKAIPWLAKSRFEEAARRFLAEQPSNMGHLFQSLERGLLRLGLILCDDLSCFTLLRQQGAQLFGLEPDALARTLDDLLRFWIHPDAMVVRRQLGLI